VRCRRQQGRKGKVGRAREAGGSMAEEGRWVELEKQEVGLSI
jgi:hypothetical protein